MQLAKKIGGGSYSTTETFTGDYWIDGKPIYKISAVLTGSYTGSVDNIDIGLTSIDTMVKGEVTAYSYSSEGFYYPFPFYNALTPSQGSGWFIRSSNWSLSLRIGSAMTFTKVVITIFYTKS